MQFAACKLHEHQELGKPYGNQDKVSALKFKYGTKYLSICSLFSWGPCDKIYTNLLDKTNRNLFFTVLETKSPNQGASRAACPPEVDPSASPNLL
jgi:hypothetical protein